MPVYLVTWDLNREKPNYAAARRAFIAHLERYQNIRDPGLDTVRFVSTSLSAEKVSTDLRLKLDDDDKIVVTQLVTCSYYGWLAKEVWDWIGARI